jgi:hypothetical protein
MDFMEITEKYQIFCDMDGVLVDLVGGVGKALYEDAPTDASANYVKIQQKAREVLDGQPLLSEHLDKTHPNFKKDTRNFLYRVLMDNRRFWMNLEWLPDGKSCGITLKNMIPVILSKPTDLQAVIGKKKWVKDNIGLPKNECRLGTTSLLTHNTKARLASLLMILKVTQVSLMQPVVVQFSTRTHKMLLKN